MRSGRLKVPGAVVLGSDFKALGLVRSLGRRGIPTVVIDDLPRSAWFSRYVTKRFRWHGAMWGPPFVDFLLSIARDHQLHSWVLFPLQDEVVELVARNVDRLSPAYRLVTQRWEILQWGFDKRLAYGIAAEIGLDFPRTWYPAGEDELARLAITLPAIIKPAISVRLQYATGRKALPAHDASQLRRQYRAAAAVVEPQSLMVQEVIPGDGRSQYSVAAFCKEGTVRCAMTARRTRQYPYDYGLSSSFVEAMEVPGLVELAERLLSRLRLTGMVEVEFKRDRRDGRFKLLDINVRPWGWHTLCIASGLDFPYLQYCDAVGQPVPQPTLRYGQRWRRLMTDIPAGLQEVRAGITTPAAYLRSLCGRSVPSVFDLRDPVPVLGDLFVAVSRAIKTGRGRTAIPLAPPAAIPNAPESRGIVA